jgi:hypothetical protein
LTERFCGSYRLHFVFISVAVNRTKRGSYGARSFDR